MGREDGDIVHVMTEQIVGRSVESESRGHWQVSEFGDVYTRGAEHG